MLKDAMWHTFLLLQQTLSVTVTTKLVCILGQTSANDGTNDIW